MGREVYMSGAGVVWASLDTEVVSLDGTTLLNRVDNLFSLGGRGNNLVTRFYNADLPIRFALPTDGTGRGIYSSCSLLNWQRTIVYNPDGSIAYVVDYALDSYLEDRANTRSVEFVAGLSGFATRGAAVALATGVVSRSPYRAIVIALKDHHGDGVFEEIGIADACP